MDKNEEYKRTKQDDEDTHKNKVEDEVKEEEDARHVDVFASIKEMKRRIDRVRPVKGATDTLFTWRRKERKPIAVVLDDMYENADFLRCLRQPSGEYLEDTLRRLLCVKKIIVVLVGAPRDIPDCTHVDVAPEIDANAVLPGHRNRRRCIEPGSRREDVFKAIQGNALLAAYTREHFRDCEIKSMDPSTVDHVFAVALNNYTDEGSHAGAEAEARAVALALFQHNDALIHRMVTGNSKALSCSRAVAEIVTTTPESVSHYRLSPAQWLAAAQVVAPLDDTDATDDATDRDASIGYSFGVNATAAFLHVTLRAAISAEATILEWITAVQHAVRDQYMPPPRTSQTRTARKTGAETPHQSSRLNDRLSEGFRVSLVFSHRPLGPTSVLEEASKPLLDHVQGKLAAGAIMILINGPRRDSFVVFFPTGVRVFLSKASDPSRSSRFCSVEITTNEATDIADTTTGERVFADKTTPHGVTQFFHPPGTVTLASLFFSH